MAGWAITLAVSWVITNVSKTPSVFIVTQNKTNSIVLVPRANYTYRATRLAAKLVPSFEDKGCCVVGTTDPYGRISSFLDPFQNHCLENMVAPGIKPGPLDL
jgi:hypothetical protein